MGSKTLLSNVFCMWTVLLSGQKCTGLYCKILLLLTFLWLVLRHLRSLCSMVHFVSFWPPAVVPHTVQQGVLQGVLLQWHLFFFFSLSNYLNKGWRNVSLCFYFAQYCIKSLKKGIKFSVKICPKKTQDVFSYNFLTSLDYYFFGNSFQHFVFLCHLQFGGNPKCFLQFDRQVNIFLPFWNKHTKVTYFDYAKVWQK